MPCVVRSDCTELIETVVFSSAASLLEPRNLVTTLNNKIAGRIMQFLSLKCLDPGSGRNISGIWHGAGAYQVGFIPKPSTSSYYKSCLQYYSYDSWLLLDARAFCDHGLQAWSNALLRANSKAFTETPLEDRNQELHWSRLHWSLDSG